MNVTYGSNKKGTEEMTPRVLELEILYTVTTYNFIVLHLFFELNYSNCYWWAHLPRRSPLYDTKT